MEQPENGELKLCIRTESENIPDNFVSAKYSLSYSETKISIYSYILSYVKKDENTAVILINSSEIDKKITNITELGINSKSYLNVYVFLTKESKDLFLKLISRKFDENIAFSIFLNQKNIRINIIFALNNNIASIEALYSSFNRFNKMRKSLPELAPRQFIQYLLNEPSGIRLNRNPAYGVFVEQNDNPFKYKFKSYEYFLFQLTAKEKSLVDRLLSDFFDRQIAHLYAYDLDDPANNEEYLKQNELVVNCFHAANKSYSEAHRALSILLSTEKK